MKRAFFSVLLTAAMITFTMLSAVSCDTSANTGSEQAAAAPAPDDKDSRESGKIAEGTENTRNAEIAGSAQSAEEVQSAPATVPELAGMFQDTQKIEVRFDLDQAARSGNKPVFIQDARIISDIGDMISQSTTLPDSYTGDMSGMKKSNRMILYHQDGTKSEVSFFYDDPAFAKGYLESGGSKFDPGYSFFRYMKDFTEYTGYDSKVEKPVAELFGKYNWTVDYRINTAKVTLPENLLHEAGEYPVKLYWAYNNELSKQIGLDFSGFLGQKADAEIYRLRESLPQFLHPMMDARGIVLRSGGRIIGAYIDAGRHQGFGCSLDGKSLQDVTGTDWDAWVSRYVDYENELEIKLSKMEPKEIIRLYYDAMNRHDEKTQMACVTRGNLCGYLSANMNNNVLYNPDSRSAFLDGYSNVKSVKLIKIDNKLEGMENPPGTVEYGVTVDYQFKKLITSSSGVQPRFILLRKETEKGGWRIAGVGTGP
jgi:hypothetical protein